MNINEEYLTIHYFKLNDSAQLDAFLLVQNLEHDLNVTPARGSPQSPNKVDSSGR